MRALSSLVVWFVAGSLAIAVTGCSASSTANWTLPTVPGDVPSFAGDEPLPFDSYTLTLHELERMQSEEATMLTDCAAKHGLDLNFGGDYIRPADDSFNAWGGRVGTMQLDHAAEFGFHPSPGGAWSPVGGFYLRDPSNLQPTHSDDPDFLSVLYGVDDPSEQSTTGGGCFGEVESTIGGPLVSTVGTEGDLINLTLAHPAVEKATKAWKACMKVAGHEYKSVQAAGEAFTMAGLSKTEIDVAVADVGCVASSRWADIFYFVLADYQKQAIAKQQGVYDESLSKQKNRLRLLDSLVGAPSS